MTSVAKLSRGVVCRLTMTRRPPFVAHCYGNVFAGETLRLVPMDRQRSAAAQFCSPSVRMASFKFSPKLMMVSLRKPLQPALSHLRPVR